MLFTRTSGSTPASASVVIPGGEIDALVAEDALDHARASRTDESG